MATPFDSDPSIYHIQNCIIGDSFYLGPITLQDENGDAISLVGASGICKVLKQAGGEVILSPTVTITTAASGIFELSSTSSSTSALIPGVYTYAIRFTFADTSVRTIMTGNFTVKRII